jgi:hypothetical protein
VAAGRAGAAGGSYVRRIGLLMNRAADNQEGQDRLAAFHQGLQELGWSVGRNVRIDTRWGGDDAERLKQVSEYSRRSGRLRPEENRRASAADHSSASCAGWADKQAPQAPQPVSPAWRTSPVAADPFLPLITLLLGRVGDSACGDFVQAVLSHAPIIAFLSE